jgi:hypothetical protein
MAQWVRSLDLTAHTSLSPIRHGFAPSFVNYKKGCTRLAAASDKVYQLLAHGRWFSPGTPASSTTKTGHHDIVEILLKVALKHQKHTIVESFINTNNLFSHQWEIGLTPTLTRCTRLIHCYLLNIHQQIFHAYLGCEQV